MQTVYVFLSLSFLHSFLYKYIVKLDGKGLCKKRQKEREVKRLIFIFVIQDVMKRRKCVLTLGGGGFPSNEKLRDIYSKGSSRRRWLDEEISDKRSRTRQTEEGYNMVFCIALFSLLFCPVFPCFFLHYCSAHAKRSSEISLLIAF